VYAVAVITVALIVTPIAGYRLAVHPNLPSAQRSPQTSASRTR
jgi:hypothetical protein